MQLKKQESESGSGEVSITVWLETSRRSRVTLKSDMWELLICAATVGKKRGNGDTSLKQRVDADGELQL